MALKRVYLICANVKKTAENIKKSNVSWKNLTAYTFVDQEKGEKITLIDEFMSIRGRTYDKVYLDETYDRLPLKQQEDFKVRFAYVKIKPEQLPAWSTH